MRVVYLGTPDFAVGPLEALAADARYTVVGVVTQPDRPVGRRGTPQPPPVKLAAERLGIPVLQPETLRDDAAIATLAAWQPDVGVVAAYGEILRRRVLELPPLGYVNIHPSLLPRWRGPTPVASAILAGDAETGVTIIKLDAKMDSGPILAQHRQPLPADALAGPLTYELFAHGTALLLDALEPYAAGTLVPAPQHDADATYARMLSRADGQIDWQQPAAQIARMVRAYHPWPGSATTWRGQPFKILSATAEPAAGGEPGMLLPATDVAAIATGDGALVLHEVQPAGKKPLAGTAWRRGVRGDERLGAH